MVGAFHGDKRREALTVRTDTLDHGDPFPIARLDLLSLSAPIGAGYDYRGRDLAYHEAGLVEVIDILVLDTVFRLQIYEKRELARDLFRVFAEGPLVVVCTRKTRPELWLSLNEVPSLTRPDAWRVTRRDEDIRYIFYIA